MYTVYILKSILYKKSYAGLTDNLDRRIKEHNSGKHSYTKRYLPWKIIYIERFPTLTEARNKEKYFKSTTGRRSMKQFFN